MRELTLAAPQFAASEDAGGERSTVPRPWCARPRRRARGSCCSRSCSRAATSASPRTPRHLAMARPFEGNPLVARFAALARELGVVLPVPFFEKAGQAHFNSVAVADADGRVLGVYRKSHIPQGPGYEEKFYFSPGDTGFRVWDTAVGRIGVAHLLGPVVPGERRGPWR